MTNKQLTWRAIFIFCVLLIIVILYMACNGFSVTTTGTLGDGFNGLMAPFISFAGAFLVYLSFREQNKANKMFADQATFDTYSKTFTEIKDDFDHLSLKTSSKFKNDISQVIENTGVTALKKFEKGFNSIFKEQEGHPFMKNLSFICLELASLIKEIHDSELPKAKKEYLLLRINRFFIAKLDHYIQSLGILIVADTGDESKPFNNYYRESMQQLRNAVSTIIISYLS